jgi:hypothetical protein
MLARPSRWSLLSGLASRGAALLLLLAAASASAADLSMIGARDVLIPPPKLTKVNSTLQSLLVTLSSPTKPVYFTDGIPNNTWPSAAANDAIPGITLQPSQPAVLDLPYWTNAFYWSAWLNTINQPFANGSFPLFGLQSTETQGRGSGEIVSVRILPRGIYPVFPYLNAGNSNTNGFTPLTANNPIVQILVQNPMVPGNSTQFFAPIDNISIGQWRWLAVSYNPFNQWVGSQATAQVALGGPGRSPPTIYTAYQAPMYGSQRTPPNVFAIPVGNAFGLGNPYAWVGYQTPFTGVNPGQTWAQSNSFVGGYQQLIFEAGSLSANPGPGGDEFPGVNLYDMANDQTLMTGSGQMIPINNRTLELPNGQGPHTPTVLLQGGATPVSAPPFLRQSYITLGGNPVSNDFVTPGGNVSIQTIEFGEAVEGRVIGTPGGGDP